MLKRGDVNASEGRKVCTKCHVPKPLTEFFRTSGRPVSGYRPSCKACMMLATKRARLAKPELHNSYARVGYRRHIEARRESGRARLRNPHGRILALLRGAEKRASDRGLSFDLDYDFLWKLWIENGGRCALTDIPFDMTVGREANGKQHHTRPFAPSVDRINPSRGYTKDNVRMVCAEMNGALHNWGEQILERILGAYIDKLDRE